MLYYHIMTSTTHTLVAIAIAAKIGNPQISLPLSFLSNYLLDMVPHWDFGFNWRLKSKTKLFLEGLLDIVVSYALVFIIQKYYLPQVNLWYMLLVAFFAQLPDWLEIPYLLFNWKFEPFAFFYRIQHFIHRRLRFPWGLLPQIAIALPLLYFAIATS